MKTRNNRSTKTTLELLIEQVHTIWNQERDKIVTLLSMNVTDVFDTVLHRRLIHNLRKYKIFLMITKWLISFLSNRVSTFSISNKTSKRFEVRTEIPQDFSISSILYFFYNVNLLNINNRQEIKINVFNFVDDINILMFSQNIKKNYRCLE